MGRARIASSAASRRDRAIGSGWYRVKMGRPRAKLEYAGLTDVGQRRLANEDAWHIDPRMGLFVVCDGIGGQPSGEAASQIVTHTLGHVVRRHLRQVTDPASLDLGQILAAAASQISHELHSQAQQVPTLKGMGATLIAAVIDRQQAFLVHVGDSRIYRYRDGAGLEAMTEDQVKHFRRFASMESAAAGGYSDDRRLLNQYIGMKRDPKPVTRTIALEPGDRLVLCTDGVTDPTPEQLLASMIAQRAAPEATCRGLIEAANAHGGPDNITAIVIDYLGLEDADPPPVPPVAPPAAPCGVAQQVHAALGSLESDLAWLRAGASELEGESMLSAFAAVKRRLGSDVYHAFLQLHPSQNPAHVFHRACTLPDSQWRRAYEQHLGELDPLLTQLAEGSVRLSPVLSAEETGGILRTLWRDWRAVETRYFQSSQREAISASDRTLAMLIQHMHQSVQTMLGLLVFFPRFMRGEPAAVAEREPGH